MTSLTTPWLLAALSAGAPAPALDVQTLHLDHVLGTSLDLVATGVDAATARRMFGAVAAEIERLDAVLSGWRADSELARLNAGEAPFTASPDLFAVVSACEGWRESFPGIFSGRMGRVEALWRADAAPQALEAAARAAEAAEVGLDPRTRTIVRPQPVVFAMDALAKGYIVDRALEAGRAGAPGARGLLVDIGGDFRCLGEGPAGPWAAGLAGGSQPDNAPVAAAIALASGGVATTGAGARRHLGGRVLSPRTGSLLETPTTTVVAADAARADVLATVLAVSPTVETLTAVEAHGAQARVLPAAGAGLQSAGWESLVLRTPARAPLRIPVAAAAEWPAGFGVRIDVNILKAQNFPYRAPYLVVWITDAGGRAVRNLVYWGDRERYQGENFVWWRSFQGDPDWRLLDSISRPSRAAGAYSIRWDGRDDQGRALPQGAYTVHVESKREGGPHTHSAIPIMAGAAPAQATGPGDNELGTTTVRYGAGL